MTLPTPPSGQPSQPNPENMRAVMADYVRTVHQSYVTVAQVQTPGARAHMPLLAQPFTVVAAGVRNLHVIATMDPLPPPAAPEVALDDRLDAMAWTVRFFDPVVLPQLGLINETAGTAGEEVRRAIGLTTHLYHLIVQPGSQLTGHHAGHAGTGLANAHVATWRDFDTIRAHAGGRESLVDEMAGAAQSGLLHAQVLLAREIAPGDQGVIDAGCDPVRLRRALIAAVRGGHG